MVLPKNKNHPTGETKALEYIVTQHIQQRMNF